MTNNKKKLFYRIKVTESSSDLILTVGAYKAVIHGSPFSIDFYKNDILYVSANAKGLLKFEHLRTKPVKQ